MKALSIYPDAVMEIFMGDKTEEYRTWRTDYRGDLLICAGAKGMRGLVNARAWFVVSLLGIEAIEDEEGRMYAWQLGAPRLIRPIPVRGKLYLFDVEDGRIEYIRGGDLGDCPTRSKANALRSAYAREYLMPLFYRPDEEILPGGLYGPVLFPEYRSVRSAPPAKTVDMPVTALLDCILNLDPQPPMSAALRRAHPELELGLARYPSPKAGAVKWLEGLARRRAEGARAAYEAKSNLLCLLWLAEALGEENARLKAAVRSALEVNTMPQRCEAFRKAIPFDRIVALTRAPEGWRLAPDGDRKPGNRV
ncbi:MAG: ASCH domain-containing protein [Clostridia bacterium]|nr:ASCH domain-containing protein [Clostridia bacterium]